MSNFKNVAYFVNSTGENENFPQLVQTLPETPFEELCILALDENLPSYTQIPDRSRKKRLEEIIKNSNAKEIKLTQEVLNSRGWPSTSVYRIEGRFPSALVDWSSKNGVDLLIKQSLPCDGEFGNASKGDIKLTRQIKVPILLLHSKISQNSPVLAALPPIFNDQSGLSLATKILSTAAHWAKVLRSPLIIVRAWELFGENLLARRLSSKEFQQALETEQRKAREELDTVLEGLESPTRIEKELVFQKGEPIRVIQGAIDENKPGLVVMGTAAHDGMEGMLLGNTAESIIRKKNVSVLLLR